MSSVPSNALFLSMHSGDPDSPDDPNLHTIGEIQQAIGTNSAVISAITSGVTSTAASGALNSIPVSTADSKAVSAGGAGSVADSKALSGSVVTSTADSKALSVSLNCSIADSKAVSVATATPVVTAIVYSANISVADSRAQSAAAALPGAAGTVGTIVYSDGSLWNKSTGIKVSVGDAYTGTGTGTTGAPRLFFGTNASSGDDSAILIGRAVAGDSLFSHAIRDESTFTSTTTGAYASFDSALTFNGSIHYNHLRSFQSRPVYTGSAALDMANGFQWQFTHSGLGTIGNCYGLYIVNPGGTGPITNNVGIWIEDLTRGGTANFAIFSAGTAPTFLGGTLQLGSSLKATTAQFTNFSTFGAVLTTDASGNLNSNPNLTIINGVLDFHAVVGSSVLLFHSSNTKYGSDIQSSTMRHFTPTGGSIQDWGKMSTTDGTTYTSQMTLDGTTGDLNIVSGVLKKGGTQVVGAHITGYTAMTGSPNKATAYDTSTVTLAQLAGRVAQLQADLTTHGLIGA